MELNTISGLAIAGVICSVVLSMGVPIALFIAGRVKLKARISSFFIGAGTFLLFAMLLEQQLLQQHGKQQIGSCSDKERGNPCLKLHPSYNEQSNRYPHREDNGADNSRYRQT